MNLNIRKFLEFILKSNLFEAFCSSFLMFTTQNDAIIYQICGNFSFFSIFWNFIIFVGFDFGLYLVTKIDCKILIRPSQVNLLWFCINYLHRFWGADIFYGADIVEDGPLYNGVFTSQIFLRGVARKEIKLALSESKRCHKR